MARGASKSLFILKRYAVPIFTVLLALLSVELSFNYLERSQNAAVWKSITSLLRNDSTLGNSYELSRTLRDMEMANWLSCVVLKEMTPSERVYFDSTHRAGCSDRDGVQGGVLTGINNMQWYLEFKPKTDLLLSVLHISLRLILVVLIGGLAFYYHQKGRKEENRRLDVERERQRLLDLTNRTSHDVASPITALRAIVNSEQLPENLRNFLALAVERTEQIFADLNKARNSGIDSKVEFVNLVDIVTHIVNEKRRVQKIPIVAHMETNEFLIRASRADLSRVVSNIINNASEAFSNPNQSSLINIKVYQKGNKVSLDIQDNGPGISADDIVKIGTKGFTRNKVGGSGLGLWSAKSTIESWGGKLFVESEVGLGTVVRIVFIGSNQNT